MDLSLLGKNAVVCGSTQGIGLAIAKELALLGATCILIARNENLLKEIVNDLPAAQSQRHGYKIADFTDVDTVQKAIQSVVPEMNVHILINNTGGPATGVITKALSAEFENTFRQHLVNNHILMQAVLPGMKAAAYGRIINIISTSVKIPIDNLGVSNTIRAAVASWSKTLSNEVGKYNITVNNILPGYTNTQRLQSVIKIMAKEKQTTEEVLAKQMADNIPMKRFGEPEEIASLAAFLASPAASYINGTSIPVDGGRTGTI